MTCVWKDTGGTPIDITSVTIESDIKGVNFSQAVTVAKTDPTNGVFTCSVTAANTANFPITDCKAANLYWDIQFTTLSFVTSTETVQIVVLEDITE